MKTYNRKADGYTYYIKDGTLYCYRTGDEDTRAEPWEWQDLVFTDGESEEEIRAIHAEICNALDQHVEYQETAGR